MSTWKERQNKKKNGSAAIGQIVGVAAAAGSVIFLILAGSYSIRQSERLECEKWQDQAESYRLFTAAKWQEDQCKFYDISL